jgi:hypothetical protein
MHPNEFLNRTCGDCVFHANTTDVPNQMAVCRVRMNAVAIPRVVPQERPQPKLIGVAQEPDAVVWQVSSHWNATPNSCPACGDYRPKEGREVQ